MKRKAADKPSKVLIFHITKVKTKDPIPPSAYVMRMYADEEGQRAFKHMDVRAVGWRAKYKTARMWTKDHVSYMAGGPAPYDVICVTCEDMPANNKWGEVAP